MGSVKKAKVEQEQLSVTLPEEWKQLPLANLVKAHWNYRTDDAAMLEKLKENIRRNKLIQNLIVRKLEDGQYEVVNGNHRLDALREIGATSATVYDLGEVSQELAERIAIETNETNFASDNLKLGHLMKKLVTTFSIDDLERTMPYNQKTMELMAKLPDFQWDTFAGAQQAANTDATTEQFETVRLRLPKDVATMFDEAQKKVSRAIERVTNRPCRDDIRPIECLSLLINHMSDDELAQSLSGE